MQTIVLISPESDYPHEHDWVMKLFEAGLSRYHIRKPGTEDDELAEYIRRIPLRWRRQVVLHQAYSLVDTFHLGGWHCQDDQVQLERFQHGSRTRFADGTRSRSLHRLDDPEKDLRGWDYVFLSPVFRSISKREYGPGWDGSPLVAVQGRGRQACRTPVYALGGVDATNVGRCREWGFDGVALLGAVWLSENPLESFLKIKEAMAMVLHP